MPLLAVLALLAVGGVAAAVVLSDRGGETPRAERSPEPTPSAEATEEPEATPTEDPTATPTPSPEPTVEAPDLERATALQVDGYNARQNGDYETALAMARAAQEACRGAEQLDPCGFALYEEGMALLELGQTGAAIAVLQQRLASYGDNESGAVRRALSEARGDGGDDDD